MPKITSISGKDTSTPRVRLTTHSTTISNIVLLGYQHLSDGAKLTYIVLESYDWPDENGYSKGRCWPTIETLAAARGKSYDSIARHLKELETAGLIKVESGQERGAANCYWLIEPSDAETQAYMERYSKKPSGSDNNPSANLPDLLPQTCQTYSRKLARPTPANLPDKEHEIHEEFKSKNPRIKNDSNPSATWLQNLNKSPSKAKPSTQSSYLSRLMDDFSRVLKDTEHAPSNRTQVNNLYVQSGLSETEFIAILYEAKKRTQWSALATGSSNATGPNRAAYFFKVVRDLLSRQAS